jgi:aminopeptidase N
MHVPGSLCMLYGVKFLCRGLVVAGVVLVGWAAAQAQRLPAGVRPEHYSLTITPNLAQARFAGSETIDVVLEASTKTITLNAAEIEFGAVRAYANPSAAAGAKADSSTALRKDKQEAPEIDAGRAQTATVTLDAAKQQATFTFAEPLAAGPVTLEIAYTGIINDKLRGFYLSKTTLRRYGVTQFESTDARRAFPSFDEPALKATFDVKLVLDAGDTAISNMQMVSDTPGPMAGKHTTVFATTPKMSTYLVAWLVGDFKCSEGKQDGIAIRACSTPDKTGLTKFALEAAKWDLHYYDKYFGIKYPLAKLDLVAIPDFDAGAMENFGCITFRETEMLVASNGAVDAKKEVATTVAHEIAHQWFGDLVTPAWWDDIWLNEGFATWMESKASAEWQPKWGFPEDAAIEKDRTMDEDARKTTRAIRTQAETPAEIDELFDDIAYSKAGAVIAMVESWVGEDAFRRGVHAYLAAHAYGNAAAEDFWNAETQTTGMPVDKVMRSFVEQPGVPLVTLGGAGANEAVSQQRFSPTGSTAASGRDERWTVPLCFTGVQCRILSPDSTVMDLPIAISGATFPYSNAADKGYYRTAYPPAELKQVEADAETGLSVPERIGLLGDQWALVLGDQRTVGGFLNLVLAVKQDGNAKVMGLALGKLSLIETKIASDADRVRLQAVVRREFEPVYAALGTAKHDSAEHAQLREELFEELGRAKDPAVLAEADAVTKQLLARQKASDPMIADAAVALASAKGDAAMYGALMNVAEKTTDPDLKAAALTTLTRFEAPELVARTLEFAVSGSVRSQDSWTLIVLLLERRETQDQAWEFVTGHWPEVMAEGSVMSRTQIVEAAGSFCTVAKRDAVAGFFRENTAGTLDRAVGKTLDEIDECIQLRANQEPALRTWLDEHGTASIPLNEARGLE